MAYSTSKISKRDKKEVLVKAEGFFRTALDHPMQVEWRKNALKCFKYKENEQWTKDELAVLNKRGQPPSVNNQISVTINRLVGQYVKFKTRLSFRGRNAQQDDELANAYTDIFRFIAQNSNLEFEEREMAEDGFTGGFGVLETAISFGDDYQPEILIKNEDAFNIFPDPYSKRYDWNEDAKFICRAKWLDLDEAQELYPNSKRELEGFVTTDGLGSLGDVDGFKKDNYVDAHKRMVRVVECWWKEKTKEQICLFDDGSVLNKQTLVITPSDGSPPQQLDKKTVDTLQELRQYQEIERLTGKMHVCVFTGGVLLEYKTLDRDRFPWVPYYVSRKKSGEPYSLIFIALPMQDAINKRESKALHLLNTNKAIFQTNAVADTDELAEEMAKPDGKIEVRNVEQFQIHDNIELAVSQFNMHNQAKEDFRRITGINPDALGESSEVRSGVGIARKVAMTDLIIAPIFDNLRRTRVGLARNVLELVQKYYTEPKVFAITDDLKQTKIVTLDQRELHSKQTIYDVVADEVPDLTTLQQEQFQIFAQTLPSILQFGPFWAKFFIQMSDLRNKEELLQMLEQQMQPPPNEPKIAVSAQLDALTPPERAAIWAKMGMPEVAQAVMELQPEPSDVASARADSEGEQIKGQVQREKAQMDIVAGREKLQMEREKHQLELQKMQADLVGQSVKLDMQAQAGEVKIEQAKRMPQKERKSGP